MKKIFYQLHQLINMDIPEKLKLEYLLALDNHIETEGKKNKEITMKKNI